MENEFTTRQFDGEISKEEPLDIKSLGEGLELVSSKKVLFSHELSTKYLSMVNCPWERQLRNHHVAFLVNEMKKRTFRPELVKFASCFCEEDSKEYRINAQHCSWSRLEIPEEEWKPELVECLKYRAVTLHDVRRLYASFDRGSPRTRANVIHSYLKGTDQFNDVNPTLIKTIAEGLSFWLWEGTRERVNHSGDDVAFLLQTTYAEVANKIVAFCEDPPKLNSLGFLRRAPVLAAMFETFSKAEKPSIEFWYAVKVGTGMTFADDARLKLRNVLMTTKTQKSTVLGNSEKVASSETVYRWTISAWNAWRAGEPIKNLRVTNKRQRAK